jgi:uncharacterized protein YlaI
MFEKIFKKYKKSHEKCLRCDDQFLHILPESNKDITFYECPECKWNFAKKPDERLHDRWLSPISMVFYGIIFSKDPREEIERISEYFIHYYEEGKYKLSFMNRLIEEIDRELNKPTQPVSQILELVHHPSEEIVRDFLEGVNIKLKEYFKDKQD